ncbi:tRNA (adenosine(37)-N6)-threonylcarbamoyltransferase complex dimerization subunit type 1 TsaB [Longimicrobium sp.]|uniref:tRNA (adenosine(37)-N6)-threonylcarbamoyltransferase complex dimerization subunit type 1 TsaB n=1 Tax=Longimicrobium sp. TaxID=2029185 RepID=UPI002BD307CE|nr:tRNA (adenosine(37)-N6)-threonylcarbamoyltransferase complex dimerization subunit type 1 TsaB [Longimicrobium sp.]HSU13023.1 tRNA (adenosine(37)-N6)-threonylcarbamoyltransferase complex dimerization subunit type 1 TsaB [Longimicrobium sp.]
MTDPISGPVLALDSSTRGGSVAVGVDGRVAAERVLEATVGASSLLMPAVDEAVRAAGLAPRDLAAVVVSGGPGSFTGLRIAAATAKALVRALDVPLFAFSGLMAAAATHRHLARPVCALFDARNREVFAGCWSFTEDGAADELLAPCILKVDDVILRVREASPLFTGDGAALHRGELEAAFGAGCVAAEADESPAAGLLWLARTMTEEGRVAHPAAWEPEYLRASGAERIAAARGG